ncbi:hypothetical protein [Aquibium oceanicum]|uniref:Uncharacterized protein n=1 Tax=Aquibium oceanicum TaxID=1670800 RepID=A0A1L3SP28_9HYPH|nr:hypothetical protein [Aquibium oceanicum]APH71166.1 hypothetical protein BSQ44_07110 [Aquibium oceanicum]
MFTSPIAKAQFAACVAGIFMSLAIPASAQNWPDINSNTRDDVTGYICVTPGCDVVRLPQSNCLCQKENPAENDLRKLKLTCSTTVGLKWVACPVKPPFGN